MSLNEILTQAPLTSVQPQIPWSAKRQPILARRVPKSHSSHFLSKNVQCDRKRWNSYTQKSPHRLRINPLSTTKYNGPLAWWQTWAGLLVQDTAAVLTVATNARFPAFHSMCPSSMTAGRSIYISKVWYGQIWISIGYAYYIIILYIIVGSIQCGWIVTSCQVDLCEARPSWRIA